MRPGRAGPLRFAACRLSLVCSKALREFSRIQLIREMVPAGQTFFRGRPDLRRIYLPGLHSTLSSWRGGLCAVEDQTDILRQSRRRDARYRPCSAPLDLVLHAILSCPNPFSAGLLHHCCPRSRLSSRRWGRARVRLLRLGSHFSGLCVTAAWFCWHARHWFARASAQGMGPRRSLCGRSAPQRARP